MVPSVTVTTISGTAKSRKPALPPRRSSSFRAVANAVDENVGPSPAKASCDRSAATPGPDMNGSKTSAVLLNCTTATFPRPVATASPNSLTVSCRIDRMVESQAADESEEGDTSTINSRSNSHGFVGAAVGRVVVGCGVGASVGITVGGTVGTSVGVNVGEAEGVVVG